MTVRAFFYDEASWLMIHLENLEMSDYLKEGDIGFKKPKKKKRANQRIVQSDLPEVKEEEDKMEVDTSGPSRNLDTNFVDDDELQAALARSRKAKMKKVPKLTPEEIAKRSESTVVYNVYLLTWLQLQRKRKPKLPKQ
jgi:hypothetical protein